MKQRIQSLIIHHLNLECQIQILLFILVLSVLSERILSILMRSSNSSRSHQTTISLCNSNAYLFYLFILFLLRITFNTFGELPLKKGYFSQASSSYFKFNFFFYFHIFCEIFFIILFFSPLLIDSNQKYLFKVYVYLKL